MNKLADDFLRPFSGAQIEQLHSYALHMQKFGITPGEAAAFARESIMDRVSKAMMNTHMVHGPGVAPVIPRCPVCGGMLAIKRVNVSKCTRVGGGYHTSVMCERDECRFTEMSKKTVEQWRRGQ